MSVVIPLKHPPAFAEYKLFSGKCGSQKELWMSFSRRGLGMGMLLHANLRETRSN